MYDSSMSRNTMLAIVALMLVALVGGAGAFWAYKKYKQHRQLQDQEIQMEALLVPPPPGFDLEQFKNQILGDAVLDVVVKKQQLVSKWGVADAAEAKALLRQKFATYIKDGKIAVRYQDKDQALAGDILKSMLKARDALYAPTNQPAQDSDR